jgi:hypothetical protein
MIGAMAPPLEPSTVPRNPLTSREKLRWGTIRAVLWASRSRALPPFSHAAVGVPGRRVHKLGQVQIHPDLQEDRMRTDGFRHSAQRFSQFES